MLEVFGSPDQGNSSNDASCHKVPSSVLPSWQTVSPGVLVFSAYCSSVSSCSSVTAVGVLQDPAVTPAQLQCFLWYEGAAQPLQGILSLSTSLTTTFTCESKYPDKTPYAVTISQDKQSLKPVQISPPSPHNSHSPLINICIHQDDSQTGDISKILRDTLIFHSFVGVSNIRLYSSALSHSVLQTIHSVQSSTDTSVTIVPWSPPSGVNSSVSSQVISNDCYYFSSQGSFQYYAVLNTHTVIMPGIRTKLSESLGKIEASLKKGPNKVMLKKFCSEYPTEKKAKGLSIPITMLESSWYNRELSPEEGAVIVRLSGKDSSESSSELGEELSFNEYKACDRFDISETDSSAVYENHAFKYSSDLISYYRKLT